MEALIIGLVIVFSALGYMTYTLVNFDTNETKRHH